MLLPGCLVGEGEGGGGAVCVWSGRLASYQVRTSLNCIAGKVVNYCQSLRDSLPPSSLPTPCLARFFNQKSSLPHNNHMMQYLDYPTWWARGCERIGRGPTTRRGWSTTSARRRGLEETWSTSSSWKTPGFAPGGPTSPGYSWSPPGIDTKTWLTCSFLGFIMLFLYLRT